MYTQWNNNLNNTTKSESISKHENFYLMKDKIIYKFKIEQIDNELKIKCKNYSILMNNNDLSILTKSIFNIIDDAYQFIVDIFDDNKVIIKEVVKDKTITIYLKIYIFNKQKDVELVLTYNNNNDKDKEKDINNYNLIELCNEIKKIKDEINILKKEIDEIKSNNQKIQENQENNLLHSQILSKKIIEKFRNEESINPKYISFCNDLVYDSYSRYCSDNTFCVFNSINKILYLIYSNNKNSIISYNIVDNIKMKEIQKAHDKKIINFKHFLDKKNNRDLIMSISAFDNNIKLWDLKNFDLLLDIKNINNSGWLNSACFLNDNDDIYICSSNGENGNPTIENLEPIKIFDLEGNKLKEIKYSKENTYFIDNYYDKKFSQNYIITGNMGFVKSYNYENNNVYHKYTKEDKKIHYSINIYNDKGVIKLIESSCDGNIRIWNFHLGEFLKRIKLNQLYLFGICLLNNEYLFVGCDDNTIKIIDLNNFKIINILKGHQSYVLSVKIISHPLYGDCLISQGMFDCPIKLWVQKSDFFD